MRVWGKTLSKLAGLVSTNYSPSFIFLLVLHWGLDLAPCTYIPSSTDSQEVVQNFLELPL